MISESLPIYNNLLVALIDITAIWLAIIMYRQNSKASLNKLFLLMVFSMLIWVNFAYAARLIDPGQYLLPIIALKFAWFATPFLFVFLHLFLHNFLEKNHKLNKFDYSVIGIGAAIAVFVALTNYVVQDIAYIDGIMTIVYGKGMIIYIGLGLYIMLAPLYSTYKFYPKLDQISKTRVNTILWGILIFYIANVIFNVILPTMFGIVRFYFFGDYSSIIMLFFITYAIIKHHTFNIKLIATEASTAVLSIILIVEVVASDSIMMMLLKAIMWVLITYGGYRLVKSVKNEVEQRKHIEKLARDLKIANKELKILGVAKDDFLNTASHELNTPISAIEGYLSMILDEGMGEELGPKNKKYLTTIYNSSKRLANLVADLLNVSRIEAGRIHIVYTKCQIEDVVEQAILEIDSEVKAHKHTLNFKKPKANLPINWMDAPRITEVVINFVGNAIKYTPDGGEIDVEVKKIDENFQFSVKDNGKGIPKDKYDKIFRKFTQAEITEDENKGTGLGLFISKNLVEMHNGKIWFESTEGKGTTFFFTIPILEEKPADPHEGKGAVMK